MKQWKSHSPVWFAVNYSINYNDSNVSSKTRIIPSRGSKLFLQSMQIYARFMKSFKNQERSFLNINFNEIFNVIIITIKYTRKIYLYRYFWPNLELRIFLI